MSVKLHTQTKLHLTDLVGASYNPRTMPADEMAALMRSLREFGFVEPVVARAEDYLILGGHQRVAAMHRIVDEDKLDSSEVEVPVVLVKGITDARAKILNVALNKISGEWDFDKLGDLLASLTEDGLTVEDMTLSGYDATEIGDILNMLHHDPVAALPVTEAQVQEGIAAQARAFGFKVETDADAAMCREVLASFGMTGPGNAAKAFVAAMAAAKAHAEDA